MTLRYSGVPLYIAFSDIKLIKADAVVGVNETEAHNVIGGVLSVLVLVLLAQLQVHLFKLVQLQSRNNKE